MSWNYVRLGDVCSKIGSGATPKGGATVYIDSGMFSFELHKDNFTVPIPKYEDFAPVKGTRLTIYLDRKYLKKENLYKNLNIEQRLLRQSEKAGFLI